MNPASEISVTIMKYKSPDGVYDFKCLDKWNVADEVERLDKMIEEKRKLEAEGYEVCGLRRCRYLICRYNNATSAKR